MTARDYQVLRTSVNYRRVLMGTNLGKNSKDSICAPVCRPSVIMWMSFAVDLHSLENEECHSAGIKKADDGSFFNWNQLLLDPKSWNFKRSHEAPVDSSWLQRLFLYCVIVCPSCKSENSCHLYNRCTNLPSSFQSFWHIEHMKLWWR